MLVFTGASLRSRRASVARRGLVSAQGLLVLAIGTIARHRRLQALRLRRQPFAFEFLGVAEVLLETVANVEPYAQRVRRELLREVALHEQQDLCLGSGVAPGLRLVEHGARRGLRRGDLAAGV